MAKKRRQQKKRKSVSTGIISDLHPRVDIVIPIHGQAELLRRCLESLSLAALQTPYQLILVDDASPEAERPALDLLYTEYRARNAKIHQNKGENQGFAWACNMGASLGNAPNILFLNSDCILDPSAIDEMIATLYNPPPPFGIGLDDDSPVGIVGAKLRFPDDSTDPGRPAGKIQHAGISFDMNGNPFHIHIGWDMEHLTVRAPACVQAVTGACLMIRRDLWSKIWAMYRNNGEQTNGAFHNGYGLGTYEDIELCFASRQLGYNVVFAPSATGVHYVGASVLATGQEYPLNRNMGLFKARWGSLVVWDEFILY